MRTIQEQVQRLTKENEELRSHLGHIQEVARTTSRSGRSRAQPPTRVPVVYGNSGEQWKSILQDAANHANLNVVFEPTTFGTLFEAEVLPPIVVFFTTVGTVRLNGAKLPKDGLRRLQNGRCQVVVAILRSGQKLSPIADREARAHIPEGSEFLQFARTDGVLDKTGHAPSFKKFHSIVKSVHPHATGRKPWLW